MTVPPSEATICQWSPGPLPVEVREAIARLGRAEDIRHIAVMPDCHLADQVCVGLAVGTNNTLYPAAVGGDIGCGMLALGFDCEASQVDAPQPAARIFDALYRRIPALKHTTPPAPDRLPPTRLSHRRLDKLARRTGLLQLGALGRGNHFVELQSDEDGRLWLMIHSGSRAMGPAIRDHHLTHATRRRGGLCGLDAHSPEGRAYLWDMAWALTYADRSRRLTGRIGFIDRVHVAAMAGRIAGS